MEITNKKAIIYSIVILRGLAALGVSMTHLQKFTNFQANKFVNFIIDQGQQGVAVFFVISGFVLPYSLYQNKYELNNFFQFLLKRSLRIDPPYWISILIYFIAASLPLTLLTIKAVLAHLTYAVPFVNGVEWFSGIYWTLSIEFQFYIILGLCFPFLIKANSYTASAILIVISILLIKSPYYSIIISKFYLFSFGYITFLAYIKKIPVIKAYFILLVFAVLVIFKISVITGLVPALTSIFILRYQSQKKLPVFFFLGNISYSLYLLHQPAMLIFIKYAGIYTQNATILFAGSLISAIILASLFYLMIEKPSIKLSRRINLTHNKKVAY